MSQQVDNQLVGNIQRISNEIRSSVTSLINNLSGNTERTTTTSNLNSNADANSNGASSSLQNESTTNNMFRRFRHGTGATSTVSDTTNIENLYRVIRGRGSTPISTPAPTSSDIPALPSPPPPPPLVLDDATIHLLNTFNQYFKNNTDLAEDLAHQLDPIYIYATAEGSTPIGDPVDPRSRSNVSEAISLVNDADNLDKFVKRVNGLDRIINKILADRPDLDMNELMSNSAFAPLADYIIPHWDALHEYKTDAQAQLAHWEERFLPQVRATAFHHYETQLTPTILNQVADDMSALSQQSNLSLESVGDQSSTYYQQGRRLENFVKNATEILALAAKDRSLTTSIDLTQLRATLTQVNQHLNTNHEFYVDLEEQQLTKSSQFIAAVMQLNQNNKAYLEANLQLSFTDMSNNVKNRFYNIYNNFNNFLRVAQRDLERLNKVDPDSDPYIHEHRAEIDAMITFITEYNASHQELIGQINQGLL